MKIYEALTEVKTLKARLVQLSNFRESNMVYDADSQPDFKYDELSEQIEHTFERMTELKLAIEAANLANTVKVGDAEMSLAKAILELSNTRTKLTHVSSMLNLDKPDIIGWRHRTKDDVPRKWQKSPAELLLLQGEYEKQKNLLDGVIQEANQKVSITV